MAEDNRQYKDRLFNFIFGAEENKAWTLSLYNAVNGSDYTDPSEIEITTIKEVMYLGMHNDVSFLVSNEMTLYEQQSSFNPNLPLRLLQYSGNLYEKYVVKNKLNKYGSTLLKLPVPKLVVFYNGERDTEDEVELRLSDSFPEGAQADIEVKVRMININYGRNMALLELCKPLKEYSWLVERIRCNKKNHELESAIDRSITEMPEDYLIKPFLMAHRSEVRGMLLTEYNEVETMQLFKEDGKKEGLRECLSQGLSQGLKEGRESERLDAIRDMVKYGDSKERILKQYTEEEYNKALGIEQPDN